METQENPTQETQETKKPLGHLGLKEFYRHPRTLEFEETIIEWFEKYGATPFTNIQMSEDEDGEVVVDLLQEFETQTQEQFGDESSDVLSDYISALVLDYMNTMDDETIAELKKEVEDYRAEQETQETQESK